MRGAVCPRAHGRPRQVDPSGFHPTIALHVALHDPTRVLREVEAKRRILARPAPAPWPCVGEPPSHPGNGSPETAPGQGL
ncbi:DUF6221 family protein [Streptomyces venezuelae]|uniref:DUF6221 family protein n=1 Tax=Streptomyces venezuelae TaxID=54571 RepID=UPI001CC26FD2|nr:DUF6221 family protein [Streptomyces venezuelae]